MNKQPPVRQPDTRPFDLDALRRKLAQGSGKQYWRSLDELADTSEFRSFVAREFPLGAQSLSGINRRQFLKLMAASLALGGIAACTPQPSEKIVPYVKQPEELVPGKPMYFASAQVLGGFANGILVESQMGRPIKIEGNPDHPASQGATDVFGQAAVLEMYDPDRAQVVLNQGRIRTWGEFETALTAAMSTLQSPNGGGLHILTETITSPTFIDQMKQLQAQYPQMRWHQYEPINRDHVYAGTQMAFGQALEPRYHLENADVILSLDADFMAIGPGRLRYIRDFTDRRRVREGQTTMNRLYAVEGTPSLTGAQADHRWRLRSAQVEIFARMVAQGLGLEVAIGDGLPDEWTPRIDALVRDLNAHAGHSLIVAGDGQPPVVHALAHAMNTALNNNGQTVEYTDPVAANPESQLDSIRSLTESLQNGEVEVLLMVGGNPVYSAPTDINFASALPQAGFSAHLSLYQNETSDLCDWHLPRAHALETWGDARAYDGTVSIIQPLIEPLYEGRSEHEIMALVLGSSTIDPYDIVHDYWANQSPCRQFR